MRTIIITGDNIINLDNGENEITELNISAALSLERLYCNDNLLTSLTVSANTKLEELSVQNNDMDKDALDALFDSLPEAAGEIYIDGNSGVAAFSGVYSVATGKGWTVYD